MGWRGCISRNLVPGMLGDFGGALGRGMMLFYSFGSFFGTTHLYVRTSLVIVDTR